MNLEWYAKRLRVMSAREVLYRAEQQVTLLWQLLRYISPGGRLPRPGSRAVAAFSFCTANRAQLPDVHFDLGRMRAADAGALINGVLEFHGHHWAWQPVPGVWHQAPDTGRNWPKRFFAGIAFREGNPFGDVRHVWEPSRLQHLVALAALARYGNRPALGMLVAQLRSWVTDNPPLCGVHYISAMECGLRLIAVCHALDMTRDQIKEDGPWHDLLYIAETHAPLVERRLSIHSSAGNHTIAESAALVYAGLLFPEMRGADSWLSLGLDSLKEQAPRQILPDGGGIEQAFSYHAFNVELLTLVTDLLTHHREAVPDEISSAVERGTCFLDAFGWHQGRLPRIGDSDNGHALSGLPRIRANAASAGEPFRTFPDAGYTIVEVAPAAGATAILDHGPLGMRPAFGHGHADALSLLLRVGSQDVITDTGTYTYTGNPAWRAYFRGTTAHNTVTVDGLDQATQQGCFLWSAPYRARLINIERLPTGGGRLVAEHDGYRAIGVRHVRGIAWSPDAWLLVWDHLLGEGRHRLDLHWHLGAEPQSVSGSTSVISIADTTMTLACEGGSLSVHRGEEDPLLGWLSPTYGCVRPIPTLKVSRDGDLPHELITTIRFKPAGDTMDSMEEALIWLRHQSTRAQSA